MNNYDGYNPDKDVNSQYKEETFFETLFRVCPWWWVFLLVALLGIGFAWGIEKVLF